MRNFTFAVILFIAGIPAQAQSTIPLWKTLPDIPVMPQSDQNGFAAVNGIHMYYAVFNSAGKDPVLLLHGGFSSSDDWGFETPLLMKTHKVIVADSRGHGRSTLGEQPLSYELMANDIVQLMDTLKIKQLSVVGWSDGGIIGLIMAMKYPGRINKLFTYGANFNHSGEKQEKMDSATASMAARFMARAKANYHRLSSTPEGFDKLKSALRELYGKAPDLDTNGLKKINIPTTIACGQYEQFYTLAHFTTLAKLIPGARLLVIPDVSHGGPLQHPLLFHEGVIGLINARP